MYVQSKTTVKTASKWIARLRVSLTPSSVAHEYVGSGKTEAEALQMAIAKAKSSRN